MNKMTTMNQVPVRAGQLRFAKFSLSFSTTSLSENSGEWHLIGPGEPLVVLEVYEGSAGPVNVVQSLARVLTKHGLCFSNAPYLAEYSSLE